MNIETGTLDLFSNSSLSYSKNVAVAVAVLAAVATPTSTTTTSLGSQPKHSKAYSKVLGNGKKGSKSSRAATKRVNPCQTPSNTDSEALQPLQRHAASQPLHDDGVITIHERWLDGSCRLIAPEARFWKEIPCKRRRLKNKPGTRSVTAIVATAATSKRPQPKYGMRSNDAHGNGMDAA